MNPLLRAALLMLASALLPVQAQTAPAHTAAMQSVAHPRWARSANIYEVNIRQYTPEGTFAAFEAQLPRLQRMGVDILWLMPVHPIGQQHRKGTQGSYYAVRDHTAVNPAFGTLAEFKHLVTAAHALGMRVIIDWVANHTAWDHVWVAQHPDWFKKNEHGEIFPVTFKGDDGKIEQWTDVVALDYAQPALRRAMIDAMAFWLREADVDGFRCDVAGLVPTPFWEQARAELDRIKPVFMLAEWNEPELHHRAFDMSYDWELQTLLVRLARGEADAGDLRAHLEHPPKRFPPDAYRMSFTSNHDINSWHGSDAELYGPAFKAMAVLAATLPGMPLIYGGQEAGLDRRIAFFEKDAIDWKQRELQPLYTDLLRLKHAHRALWNGSAGAPVTVLPLGNQRVFGFERRRDGDAVTVLVNLSGSGQAFELPGDATRHTLPAWGYRIVAAQ